jgi:hypothetical protein
MAVDQFGISETMKEVHAIAVILARGYLRWRSADVSEAMEKPSLGSIPACLDLTPRILVSVPSGELTGDTGRPQHDPVEEETDGWNWI